MNEVELLPCPFCGGPAEIIEADEAGPSAYAVQCQTRGCEASSRVAFALGDDVAGILADAWNRRSGVAEGGEAERVASIFKQALEIAETALEFVADMDAVRPVETPVIETRNEAGGYTDHVNEDVPTIVRDMDGPVSILLDMNSRKIVGYRVWDAPKPFTVRPSDPLTIIAGIRKFGLAADGADLRDLETAIVTPKKLDPATADLVQRLNALADGIEVISWDRRSTRRGVEKLIREAIAALTSSNDRVAEVEQQVEGLTRERDEALLAAAASDDFAKEWCGHCKSAENRVKELARQIEELRGWSKVWRDRVDAAETTVARLTEALRRFAEVAVGYDSDGKHAPYPDDKLVPLPLSFFRLARAALSTEQPKENSSD